jgi:hypothetical protein
MPRVLRRSCAHCNVPWHKGLTCAEQAATHLNDLSSDTKKDTLKFMQEKDAPRCPNRYIVVVKDGSCYSMFCYGCLMYFNWRTAPSAVLDAKKAELVYNNDLYSAAPNEPLMCEADAIAWGFNVKREYHPDMVGLNLPFPYHFY